jgi:hypothetical protein
VPPPSVGRVKSGIGSPGLKFMVWSPSQILHGDVIGERTISANGVGAMTLHRDYGELGETDVSVAMISTFGLFAGLAEDRNRTFTPSQDDSAFVPIRLRQTVKTDTHDI